jgi:sugar O-acyltransferase (sialic acid O-acetyltransferase NeuD family)
MATERIVLVGAGDHGRGVLEIVRAAGRAGSGQEVVGFVDDAPTAGAVDGVPLLGTTAWLLEHLASLDASGILAMASPSAKRRLAARLDAAGVGWARAVHPNADLAPSVSVGLGSVVGSGVVVVYDTRIGAHVTVNLNATVGHHVEIGDFATVAPGANILGKARIGDGAQIHANAVVLPSVRIGAGATVGAGSVALKDVADGVTVFGNPARPLPGA